VSEGVSETIQSELPERWAVRSVFGGWIAFTLAKAAESLLPGGRVLASASISFSRAVPPGPVTITSTVVRSGRSYGFVTSELSTPAGIAVTAQFTFVPRERMPVLPAPGPPAPVPPAVVPSLSASAPAPGGAVAARVDWRAESDWSDRDGGATPFVAWIRALEPILLADVPVSPGTTALGDPAWYLVAADLIGPALVTPAAPAFWVATVTLDVQVHGLTAESWLRQTVSAHRAGPDAVGSLSLADVSGAVLATATQRAVLVPGETGDLPFSVTAFGWGVHRSAAVHPTTLPPTLFL
jgi:hypothetical protein